MLSNIAQKISLRGINMIVLLITIFSLSANIQKGSFIRHYTPNAFQWLLVVSIVLTVVYLVKSHQVKEFFFSVPQKILIALGSFIALTLIGWGIAILYLDIPTTAHTILDFGTFSMSVVLFFLVSFYAKGNRTFMWRCLGALLIPNVHLLYYFFTHGLVGYWGVVNDFSLDLVLDPNILSKTLLVPALFFIGMALFSFQNKQWRMTGVYVVLGSTAVMMVLWTVSRGSLMSLVVGATATWFIFALRTCTWKKIVSSAIIIFGILLIGYSILPYDTKQAIILKSSNTFTIPPTSGGKIANITVEEIRKLPQTESRLLIWYFYPRYIWQHPFGVGPNASHNFGFTDKNGTPLYVGPDSTYLVIALWGGVLGLVICVYIVLVALFGLWKKWQKNADSMSFILLSILFTLSAALFFDGMMALYCFYIVLALSLQHNEQH